MPFDKDKPIEIPLGLTTTTTYLQQSFQSSQKFDIGNETREILCTSSDIHINFS